MKFTFADDNIEMFTSEKIKITNNGNGPGKFKFMAGEKKIFSVKPEEGEVKANSNLELEVFYKPS